MANKYLDNTGIAYFTEKIKEYVASIPIGGRNLMLNTYEPSLRNDFRPTMLGQTTMTGINTNNVITLAEHGVRITATDAHYPIIRFGSSSATSGDMNGLKPGQTYTFSADCKWKLLSNDTSTTARYVRCYANVVRQGGSAFELLTSANDGNVKRRGTTETVIQKGVEQSGRMDTTFTIPDDAVAFYMRITSSDSNNTLHASGDFLELANIKFEEGARCTNWSPAPEDIIRKTELNLRYSGVNLLHGTNDISDSSKWFLLRSAVSSNNSVILTPTTSSSYAKYKINYLTYGQLLGQTVTLSFDMRVLSGGTYTDVGYAGAYIAVQKTTRIDEQVSSSYDRYSLKSSSQTVDGYNKWNRYTISWLISPDELTSGVSDASDVFVDSSYVTFQLYRAAQSAPAEFKNIKLELGGVGTGWSLSPSDTSAPSSLSVQIPFCQYTGSSSSLNLASGTITQIPLDTSIFANTSDFILENNGIKVLKAGTYKITGAVYISPGSSATGYGAYIRKGTGAFSDATEIMSCLYAKPTDRGHNGAIICGPKYVSLNANDIVYLAARSTGAAGTCSPSHDMTYLLIENSKLSTIPVPTITQDSTTNGLTII